MNDARTYRAEAWWDSSCGMFAVRVYDIEPDRPYRTTQGTTVGNACFMARDLVACVLDIDPDQVSIDMTVLTVDLSVINELWPED